MSRQSRPVHIWVSCGTAAELIKLFPVLLRFEKRGWPWTLAFTGQSPVSCLAQFRDFRFDEAKWKPIVVRHKDLERAKDAAAWLLSAVPRSNGQLRRALRTDGGVVVVPRRGDLWIVHGDTLSTLLGATMGLRLGCRVVHVEAGMRSGTIREPFPEEIVRRTVGQLATVHFAPHHAAYTALLRERARGPVVETDGNTQIDAIIAALELPPPDDLPTGAYGLVNVHRYETLVSAERLAEVKATLLAASTKHKLVVVAHETANAAFKPDRAFIEALEKNGAVWLPRQPFTKFAHWLDRASFVIADSGGNQQECSFMGIPCLLLRQVTETPLDETRKCVVLSRFDKPTIDRFLADPASYREPRKVLPEAPSDQILRTLAGYVDGARG